MVSFTLSQIETALDAKSRHLSPYDIRRVANNKDAVMKMLAEMPPAHARARRQARVLFEIISAAATGKMNIPPEELRDAAGALIYLSAPVDIVPDDEEDGFADDAAVIELATQRSAEHVRSYCTMFSLNEAEYLG